MASFNRVILLGNLTRDPEHRTFPSGSSLCKLGLAVNDRRKGPTGEWVDETTFVDVTVWGKQADTARDYLKKGQPCLIEGRLKLDAWESKEGEKRSKLIVVADRLQLLGGRGSGGSSGAPEHDYEPEEGGSSYASTEKKYGRPSASPPAEDDIPF